MRAESSETTGVVNIVAFHLTLCLAYAFYLSMIFFVPRLKPKTVENRVLKLLVKMMQDPEASIRTNALICVGRVAGQLPAASVSQTLMTVIGMGLKEPKS
eukprot:s405_g4.t1